MTRTLATAVALAAALLTGCSGNPPDVTGDSNTENQQTQTPAPLPTE